jgi:hypothetical protein
MGTNKLIPGEIDENGYVEGATYNEIAANKYVSDLMLLWRARQVNDPTLHPLR